MTATSKTLESRLRATVFILAALGMSASITWSIFKAQEGDFITTFLSMFLAWNSYLLAHYAETGRVIDPRQDESFYPFQTSELILAGIGLIMLLSGVFLGSIAISSSDFLFTALSVSVLITGYFIAHYATTDLLV